MPCEPWRLFSKTSMSLLDPKLKESSVFSCFDIFLPFSFMHYAVSLTTLEGYI